jgi:hypothetical protein
MFILKGDCQQSSTQESHKRHTHTAQHDISEIRENRTELNRAEQRGVWM